MNTQMKGSTIIISQLIFMILIWITQLLTMSGQPESAGVITMIALLCHLLNMGIHFNMISQNRNLRGLR